MVTGGAQRARRVDQCVAGAVVQTRGLEQFTGLDRGGEGCQLRAPVAMNERLRQEQIGALDTPGAAKGLIGQCLGIVVRASPLLRPIVVSSTTGIPIAAQPSLPKLPLRITRWTKFMVFSCRSLGIGAPRTLMVDLDFTAEPPTFSA